MACKRLDIVWLSVACAWGGAATAQPLPQESSAESTAPTTAIASIPVAAVEAPGAEPAESARERSRSRIIEEIVVTSQKREEALQDVPISVAAFSADSLDARGIFDTKSLAKITPSLTITEWAGYTFVYIRGVGTDAFVPSEDPSVTTYIDGVFVPQSQGLMTDLGGIERVEVLKGPQGTLFGRNSTGGAISVITKRPGNTFEASGEAQIGNYNERRAKGYVNLPIGDSLGISLDLLYKQFDHQYHHENRELPQEESLNGRVRANWHPTDTLEFDLTYYRSQQELQGTLISKNIAPSPLGTLLLVPPGDDNYLATADYPTRLEGTHEITALGVSWSLPWFDLKLNGADQQNPTDITAYDFDGSAAPLVGFTAQDQYGASKTVELQLSSRPDGVLGESFQWTTGAYYLDGDGGYKNVDLFVGRYLADYLIDQAAPLPGTLAAALQPLADVLGDELAVGVPLTGILGTRSKSVFADVTWHATDWLDLTLGGRYQDEKRTLEKSTVSAGLPESGIRLPLIDYAQRSTRTTNFSPRVVLSARPREGLMVYLSRAEGFKSATYNIINVYQIQDAVRPELVTSYELGMKGDFFDGLLRLNAAIFDTAIKDKHVQVVSLIAGGVIRLGNAEKATVRGAEFDAVIVPFADWNPGLAVTASGSYLDAVYNKFTDGKGFDETSGIYTEGLDFSGNKIERTPKFAGNLAVVQTLDAGADGDIEIGLDGSYTDPFFFDGQNSADLVEDDKILTNARLSYLHRPWDLRLTVFGQNIFDERYHVGLYKNDFGVLSNLAYGAQYGLRVDWAFH